MARQLDRSVGRAGLALEAVLELPVGGTAVGSGINTHPEFARRVCRDPGRGDRALPSSRRSITSRPTPSATAWSSVTARLRTIAATLFTVANNIRWLGSGPQTRLPRDHPARPPAGQLDHARQGQSGDVREPDAGGRAGDGQRCRRSPLCGAAGGQFQLNIMMPVMADAALESVRLLAGATAAFTSRCLVGHGGECRGLPSGSREEPGDGHRPESVHRLRAGGRAGQGGA